MGSCLLRYFARGACALLAAAVLPATAIAATVTSPDATVTNWGPVSAPTTSQTPILAPGASAGSTVTPDNFTSCAQHYLCMWWDANYSGDMWERSNYATQGSHHYAPQNEWLYVGNDNNGRLFNDKASSIYCGRPLSSCQIDKDWYPGNNSYCLPAEWHASDLSGFVWPDGSGMNDTISSFQIQSFRAC